jgi:hypothetical protein
VQRKTLPMAERLGDNRSKTYALVAEIFLSTLIAPKTLHDFQTLKDETIAAACDAADAYVGNNAGGWSDGKRCIEAA